MFKIIVISPFKYLCLVMGMLTILIFFCQVSLSQPRSLEVEKIWDQAPHNAFTDLVRFKNAFYCTFREGSGHVPGTNGTIRILKSPDGKKWASAALLEKSGFDLRDPGFSVTSDGKLMVLMGGSVYENGKLLGRNSHVSFFDAETEKFCDPQPVKFDKSIKSETNWLWRIKWFNNLAYGVIYSWQDTVSSISLLSSGNGIDYTLVKSFDIGGRPNETALRFLPDGEMIILVRREDKDQDGMMGRSKYPYRDWEWINTGFKLGGPNFIITPSEDLIIGTRIYDKDGPQTGLLCKDSEGKFHRFLVLPSGGDTSYPGMAIHKKRLFISYYSGHEGKTSIYLASLPMKEISRLLRRNSASPFK